MRPPRALLALSVVHLRLKAFACEFCLQPRNELAKDRYHYCGCKMAFHLGKYPIEV